jgi:HAD domain in Swiss Army Knife RNA repair proteins
MLVETKPLSIIFLEFEGVLFETKIDKNRDKQSEWMDPIAVGHLMHVIEEIQKIANVGLVITSSWRNHHNLDELKQMLEKQPFAKSIFDKTADDAGSLQSDENNTCYKKYEFYFGSSREKQIEYWLLDHKKLLGVQRFVIIDQMKNDEDHRISKLFPGQLVKCDKLLTAKQAKKMISILSEEKKEEKALEKGCLVQ